MKLHRFYFLIVFFVTFLNADDATNFSRPFDAVWDTENWISKDDVVRRIKVGLQTEAGATRRSFNTDAKRVGLFEEYQPTQSAIAMLSGADADSPQAALLDTLQSPVDDGVRGNFKVTGRYQDIDTTLFGRLNFQFKSIPGYFDVTAFLPIRDIKITDIAWNDLTQLNSPEDILVQEDLTSKIETLCEDFGGLSIIPRDAVGNPHALRMRGIGDAAVQVRWHKNFAQLRRYLKYVRITARGGITVPTGKVKDEDQALSMNLGNDGAFGLPLGGSLDLWFRHALRFGFDVDFLKLFDTTRERRLKTDMAQTELLLLNKGRVRKKYGSFWKFNIHGGIQHVVRGLSAMVAYEYKMHNDDKFFSQTNSFDDEIINTAESLKEWTTHSLIAQASYDCFIDFRNFILKPQFMMFVKVPFAGRRSIAPFTIGGEIVFNF